MRVARATIVVLLLTGSLMGSAAALEAAPSSPRLVTIEGSYLSQRPQGDACRIVIDVIGAGFSGGQSQAEVRGRMVLRQGCIALSAGDPVSGEVLASNIRMRRINLEGGIRGTVYTARVAGTLADDGTLTAGGGRPNGRIVVVGDVLEP